MLILGFTKQKFTDLKFKNDLCNENIFFKNWTFGCVFVIKNTKE